MDVVGCLLFEAGVSLNYCLGAGILKNPIDNLDNRTLIDHEERVLQPLSLPCKVMPATLKKFEEVFPQLVQDLIEHCKQYGLPQNALEWFEQVKQEPS